MVISIEVALKEIITPALIMDVLAREKEIYRVNPNFVFDAKRIASIGSEIINRTNLTVPFSEKDKVKALGAKWDSQNKTWYVLGDTEKFSSWIGKKSPYQGGTLIKSSKKITVIEYLRRRHPTVNALTAAEARILGIKYPLKTGWVTKHGRDEISEETVKALEIARSKRKNKQAKKSHGVR